MENSIQLIRMLRLTTYDEVKACERCSSLFTL